MRLAHFIGGILGVDGARAGRADCRARRNRLPAASDASAGTGHEFDEMAFAEFAARFDVFHHALGVGGSMGHRNLQCCTFQPLPVFHDVFHKIGHRTDFLDGDFRVADALHAAHGDDVRMIKEVLHLLPCDQFNDRSKGGLHHAAGRAEDHAGTGGGAKGIIEVGLLHGGQVDAGLADHLRQLARGQAVVNVLEAAVAHFRAVALELLGGAGHQGHGDDILRVNFHQLGIVGLDDRAEHLLRALGR